MSVGEALSAFNEWLYQIMDFINDNKILMILLIGSLMCGVGRVVYWLTDD